MLRDGSGAAIRVGRIRLNSLRVAQIRYIRGRPMAWKVKTLDRLEKTPPWPRGRSDRLTRSQRGLKLLPRARLSDGTRRVVIGECSRGIEVRHNLLRNRSNGAYYANAI